MAFIPSIWEHRKWNHLLARLVGGLILTLICVEYWKTILPFYISSHTIKQLALFGLNLVYPDTVFIPITVVSF